jgi:hypothetical protein
MPEIGTSGSMSGDGKRSAAAWPKLPRPSSTLPSETSADERYTAAFGGNPDIGRASPQGRAGARPDHPITRPCVMRSSRSNLASTHAERHMQ